MSEHVAGNDPEVLFVVSHLQPRYGMEKTAEIVAGVIAKRHRTAVLAISGEVSAAGDLREVSLGTMLRGPRRVLAVPRLLKGRNRLKADVIVLVGAWAALPWLIANSIMRSSAAVVVWEHSLMDERISSSAKVRLMSVICDRMYGRADVIIGVSPPLVVDLTRRIGKVPVSYLPNPILVDPTTVSDNDRVDKRATNRVIMVGSLQSLKRHDLALEALALLDERFTLTIVGDGPRRADLEEKAQLLKMTHRVKFLGYLSDEEVRYELVSHDVLLHCSEIETFGLVLTEAAEAGTRVVVTANRTSEWLVPKYVPGVVSEARAEELKTHIEKQSGNMSDSRERSSARAARTQEFGVARVATEWEQLLALAADRRRAKHARRS